MPCRRNPYT